jgi:hypothetical protein
MISAQKILQKINYLLESSDIAQCMTLPNFDQRFSAALAKSPDGFERMSLQSPYVSWQMEINKSSVFHPDQLMLHAVESKV